ncbi:hypothetical protein JHFBIEKO_3882 [Methylobacterium mesophilicum]|nr:hypothetical protein JHFBIEKO_3882 [Methylobacterium mesophilicum]
MGYGSNDGSTGVFLCRADAPMEQRRGDIEQQQAVPTLRREGEGAMIVLESEDRVARRIDRALLGAAMLSLTLGLAAGLWGVLQ